MKPFGGIASICRNKKVTVLAIVLLLVGLSVFILYPGNNALSFSKELVVIDNLSDDNPEAASVRLNAMRHSGKHFSEPDKWYIRLLTIKINDKMFVKQKDAVEATKVLRYFEKNDAGRKILSQAYYYVGSAYRDMNDMPMALEYYHKAKDEYGEHADKLSSALNFQIGMLLYEQSFYQSALPYFRSVFKTDSVRRDTAMMAYTLQKIAYAYQAQGSDSCLAYYRQALKISSEKRDTNLYNEMLSSMASYYLYNGEYDKAKNLALPVVSTAGEDNPSLDSFYDVLALSYFRLGRCDSARYYFTKLYNTNTAEAKKEASKYLAKIYREEGDITAALDFILQYEEYDDSLKKNNVETSIARMNAMYNYSKYKERTMQLEIRARRIAVLISLSAIAVVFILVWGVLRYRKLKRAGIERSMRLEKFRASLQEQSENSINEREKKISELENKLSVTHSFYAAKAKEIELLKESLKNRSNMISSERALSDNVRFMFMETEICSIIETKAKNGHPLSADETEMLLKEANRLFPSFKLSLFSICTMSAQDFLMCLLIKVSDLSDSRIAVLLGRGRSTISKAKSKLQRRLLGKDCTGEEFDKFLKSL